ncbi:MAG: DUF4493 domain-containing protein [Parabacteroides sp.]|nr:DUF4493 domain-containing protein [Parabacteroides sp.]
MRKLRTLLVKMACALAGGLMLSACSSEEEGTLAPEGKGSVQLSLAAEMGFETKTKAVDEGAYLTTRPLDDYKVKILNNEGQVVSGCEWTYSNVPKDLIELSNGSYKVVAYDGEEFNSSASTRAGIYMYGSTAFDVNSDQVTGTKVSCKPACGKLVVKFGDTMATYFSDYAVHFATQAAGENASIIWPKGDTDPLYVKLAEAGENVKATFVFTKKDGTKANVDALTRAMKWGSMWTITVNPKVEDTTGKLGITITFDDSTNDKPIDIEIPSNWL